MASQAQPSTTPFALTKDYIRDAFKLLEEVDDLDKRNSFFEKFMVPDVKWEITGSAHDMAGTRHNLADHSAASFNKLGASTLVKLKALNFEDISDVLFCTRQEACQAHQVCCAVDYSGH